jgi:hypothetical protein
MLDFKFLILNDEEMKKRLNRESTRMDAKWEEEEKLAQRR